MNTDFNVTSGRASSWSSWSSYVGRGVGDRGRGVGDRPRRVFVVVVSGRVSVVVVGGRGGVGVGLCRMSSS